ncbi:MAG: hypothetical protein ACLS54_10780 [Anaerostipes hadrus]
MNEEKLIKRIKELEENLDILETPCIIQDSDTVLADVMMSANYEENGIQKSYLTFLRKLQIKMLFLNYFIYYLIRHL